MNKNLTNNHYISLPRIKPLKPLTNRKSTNEE